MKTPITSMKRAFLLVGHGLTTLFVGIANWFTVILGMRDDSRYGKFLRRVVGSCFALLMLMMTAVAAEDYFRSVYYKWGIDKVNDDSYFDEQYLSRSVAYYSYYDEDGYVKTADGKKTITGIKWIAKPFGNDSLVCYSDGKKRGYFNMFTGKPAISPRYSHAWVFSDGLASVDDNGWIKFIDAAGQVVIDPKIPYIPGTDGYVFHHGYCVLHCDRRDRFGMIDKEGKWVLSPEYDSIEASDTLWIVGKGREQGVIDKQLKTVVPYLRGRIWVGHDYISVTLDSHVLQRYTRQGELMDDFFINAVERMTYESDELRYFTSKYYNDGGTLVSETEDAEPQPVKKMAKCRRYEAEYGWYGLMTADGKVVTPPSYSSIEAIGYDMYLCKDNHEDGVLLNGDGKRIN